jgi:hypothetical protein
MIRVLLALSLALFLGVLWGPSQPPLLPSPEPSLAPVTSESDVAPVTSEDPTCVGSCSAVSDGPSKSDPAKIRAWLHAFASQPMSSESPALEALLFHREATKLELFSVEALALDTKRAEFLARELERDTAYLEVRVRDAAGRVRIRLPEQRVALDEKQHIETENDLAQHVEYSGTVKRVGLDHLWVRL